MDEIKYKKYSYDRLEAAMEVLNALMDREDKYVPTKDLELVLIVAGVATNKEVEVMEVSNDVNSAD